MGVLLASLLGLALAFTASVVSAGSCTALNECSGHGRCDTAKSVCQCYTGWGADVDVALYKAPDCSLRSCPADRAWADVPTDQYTAHAVAECSNAGICDRDTGRCRCFAGYEGEACQRSVCFGSTPCSGHGRCVSIAQMALEPNAVPFGGAYNYGGNEASTTWDEEKIQGCVCDSAWGVGYGAGQYQAAQWFGPDCSLKHCPSGDDPRTSTVVEEDCEWYDDNGATYRGYTGSNGVRYKSLAAMPSGVTALYSPNSTDIKDDSLTKDVLDVSNAGATGNKCFVECSNRGSCDYGTGTCTCFRGYAGTACEIKSTLYA